MYRFELMHDVELVVCKRRGLWAQVAIAAIYLCRHLALSWLYLLDIHLLNTRLKREQLNGNY